MSSSQPQNDSPEHDMAAYLRVSERLARRGKGFPIKTGTPLGAALTKLSCTPSTLIPFADKLDQQSLKIGGENAGTLLRPNVSLILQKSKPSSFGRGDQTVVDPEYRYGREIVGDDIEMQQWLDPFIQLEWALSATLFIGRQLKLKLHKLAIYEPGGHFEWHRDSTHSDKHHATVLLALNTDWTGGDLLLRRNGVETRVDMHPQASQKEIHEARLESLHPIERDGDSDIDEDEDIDEDIAENGTILRAVAFYTDTEHKVEPVSSGVRIVLQYDVEVDKENVRVGISSDSDEEDSDPDDEEMDVDSDEDVMDSKLESAAGLHISWVGCQDVSPQFSTAADEAATAKVSAIIAALHASGVEEVAFPLQHLYRKASIRPEYLKGPDWIVYNALKALFDVSLHPVLLEEEIYEETQTRLAYIFESNDPPNGYKPLKSAAFYLPKLSAIEEVSRQSYIEHTGNEAQPAEYKYFGGGMFVRPKTTQSL